MSEDGFREQMYSWWSRGELTEMEIPHTVIPGEKETGEERVGHQDIGNTPQCQLKDLRKSRYTENGHCLSYLSCNEAGNAGRNC